MSQANPKPREESLTVRRPEPPLKITRKDVKVFGVTKPKAVCGECPCYHWPGVFAPHEMRNRPRVKVPTWDYFFVGEAPGGEELLQGRPFIGPAGRLLASFMRHADVARYNTVITNAARCAHGSAVGQKPPREAFRRCTENLRREIKAHNPRILIALGDTALQSVFRIFPEVRKLSGTSSITQLDGIDFPVCNTEVPNLFWIAVRFHPAYFLKPGRARQVEFAYEKYARLPTLLEKVPPPPTEAEEPLPF